MSTIKVRPTVKEVDTMQFYKTRGYTWHVCKFGNHFAAWVYKGKSQSPLYHGSGDTAQGAVNDCNHPMAWDK